MKLKSKILLVVSFICFTAVYSQDKMTPELLWKLKRVGGVKVSPDYSKALYSVSEYDISTNGGSSEYKMLGLKNNEQIDLKNKLNGFKVLAWYDADNLLVRKGDVVSMLNLETGLAKKISSVPSGAHGVKISPDHSVILFVKDVKLDQTVNEKYTDLPQANARVMDDLLYRHWDDWHDFKYSHVFVMRAKNGDFSNQQAIDLMPNEKFDAPLNPFGGMEQIAFSNDSKSIVYTCKKLVGKEYAQSTNSQLYQYDLETKKTICLTEKRKGYDVQPVFSSNGNLAWLSMAKNGFESDKNDIILKSSDGEVNLTKDIDLTVSDFVFNEKGDKIYFKSVIEATYQLFELDIKTKIHQQITTGQHNYGSLAFAGKKLIATRQDMNHPNDIYSVGIKKGKQTKITDENKLIFDELKLCGVEKRWITTSDDKKMLTWVIYPPDFDSTKTYPTLLYCQGGPQSAVSQFYSFRWNFQLMASQGYIVVAPNRRGLPGFGQEWNDAISKDWGGQPMRDYLAAIDEVSKESYVDENKLGAVGASYGGYSVYYLAGIHENRFKTFISHCGLFNLESWYGATEELFFANWDIGGPYWKPENKELYEKNSPHKLVQNWNTPIMVIHGGKDFRVPLSEGMQAFQAAQLQGVPSKFLYFPEESHWVLSPQNGLVWHREFFGWLDQWLKK